MNIVAVLSFPLQQTEGREVTWVGQLHLRAPGRADVTGPGSGKPVVAVRLQLGISNGLANF